MRLSRRPYWLIPGFVVVLLLIADLPMASLPQQVAIGFLWGITFVALAMTVMYLYFGKKEERR